MRSSETGLQVSARPASRASREGGSAGNGRRARRTEIPWVSVLLQYGGAGAAAHPRGSRGALREALARTRVRRRRARFSVARDDPDPGNRDGGRRSLWRNGMSTLVSKTETRDALCVTLSDGRVVSAPLVWFPRLADASNRDRSDWELIGGGFGIHWEAIDEDISVASLLRGDGLLAGIVKNVASRWRSAAWRARSRG